MVRNKEILGAYSQRLFKSRLMILPNQKSLKTGLCKIYLEVTITDKTNGGTSYSVRRIDTKQECFPDEWSTSKKEVKPKNSKSLAINSALRTVVNKANLYFQDTRDTAYSLAIPSQLEDFDKRFNLKKKKTLIEFLEEYYQYRKNLPNAKENTYKVFKSLKTLLVQYEKDREKTLYFESITFDFAEDFKKWANDKDADPNSTQKRIINLITFLNHYFPEQIKHSIYLRPDFREKKFKEVAGTHNSYPMPLFPDEVEKLYKFDISKIEPKKLTQNAAFRIRNLFLLSCFTGLRYSDVILLSKGNVQGNKLLVNAQKTASATSEILHIPLLDVAKEIFERIDYDISKVFLANPTANEYIKILLKEAGINKIVKYTIHGKKKETNDVPKSEVITFHNSRDTFITNALISGRDVPTVMGWSGHTKYDEFRKYVKLSESYLGKEQKKLNTFFTFKRKK